MYPGSNSWKTDTVTQSVLAVVKLDLPEWAFMIGLLADIEVEKGSVSVKRNTFNPVDIAHP